MNAPAPELNNPFFRQSIGAPAPRHRLGLLLPYRGLATAAYVPNRWEREKLRGGRPFSFPANWQLSAQASDYYQCTFPGEFALAMLLGESYSSAGATVSLFDDQRKIALTERPMQLSNIAGKLQTGTLTRIDGRLIGKPTGPFWLKRFLFFDAGESVLVRVTNLSTAVNWGQVILRGYLLPPTDEAASQLAAWQANG